MELLQLEYFCTVAKLEHMTKAAEALRVAQPALSRTIARLEESIGVPLFDRNGRSIRLNVYGQTFLKRAQQALATLNKGRQEVLDMAGLARGVIRLATTSVERLAEPFLAFRRQYPDVHFCVVETCVSEMAGLLDKGDADLCFTAQMPSLKGLVEQEVYRERLALAVPPNHRLHGRDIVAISDLIDESFVGYRSGHPRRALLDDVARRVGLKGHIVCEVVEPEALISLVRAGLGIAIVPETCANTADRKGSFNRVAVDHEHFHLTYKITWLADRYLSAAATAFRDFLVRYFAEGAEADESSRMDLYASRAVNGVTKDVAL